MHPKDVNDLFLKSLTKRLTKENQREVILLGDFNIIYVNFLLFQIALTLTTPKKKSSKGTLKTLKNKTFFQT